MHPLLKFMGGGIKTLKKCIYEVTSGIGSLSLLFTYWVYVIISIFLFEPWHEISNNVVCATSKVSDQPAHTRSLIRAIASCLNIL